ncbi:thioesterase family protein [Oceanobacillus sp. Castelsardo]|uniref:acyl-CoA thioesterase n=1 Tax=Oceanobacillus sp. Castelsardo TaxID=1851204 RepID=UPI00083983FB|nr:thioesterase family protein [Oceanobacillus sp. Castelsardo]
METNEIEVYVRFSETDAAGHVNNTSYFLYLEEARTKYITQKFKQVNKKEKHSLNNFILASTKCDYISQAYAGDILKVKTTISHIGNKSFTFNHVITNANTDQVVIRASATLVSFNYSEQTSQPIPAEIRGYLERNLNT